MEKKKKQPRGSVLVFAMLVLSMLLALAISGATLVIVTKNSSRSTEKSMFAFQVADGAVEAILKRVYKDTDTTLNDLESNLSNYHTASCSNGTISGALSSGSGSFSVVFYENNGSVIACSDSGWRAKVVRIVSTGSFAGTTRALDVGIKPP